MPPRYGRGSRPIKQAGVHGTGPIGVHPVGHVASHRSGAYELQVS
jgi:hypothetical protein